MSSGGRRLSRRMARAAAVAWHQRQSLSRSITGTSLHSWSIRSWTSSMLAARSSVQSIASKVRSPKPGRGSMATSPRVRPALRMLDRWRSPWRSPAGPPLASSRAFRCPSARICGVTSGLTRGLLSSPPIRENIDSMPWASVGSCPPLYPAASRRPASSSATSLVGGSSGWSLALAPGSILSSSNAPVSRSASRRSTTCGVAVQARSATASSFAMARSGVSLSTTPRLPCCLPINTRDVLPAKALSSSRCQRRQYRSTISGNTAHQASTPAPNRAISLTRLSSSSTKLGSSMGLSWWEAPICATGNSTSHSWKAG